MTTEPVELGLNAQRRQKASVWLEKTDRWCWYLERQAAHYQEQGLRVPAWLDAELGEAMRRRRHWRSVLEALA